MSRVVFFILGIAIGILGAVTAEQLRDASPEPPGLADVLVASNPYEASVPILACSVPPTTKVKVANYGPYLSHVHVVEGLEKGCYGQVATNRLLGDRRQP
jgi:hypothetical protein